MNRIGTQVRPDSPLLEYRDRRRQGARAQQQGEIACRLYGEAAGDNAAAAEDGLANDRCADYLVVEHDGKRPADILACGFAKAFGASGIEAEAYDRLVVLKGR